MGANPVINSIQIMELSSGVPQSWNYPFIVGRSRWKVKVNATPSDGSAGFRWITVNGQSWTGSASDMTVILPSSWMGTVSDGMGYIFVEATDTNGKAVSRQFGPYPVIAYTPPSLSISQVMRTDASGKFDLAGKYVSFVSEYHATSIKSKDASGNLVERNAASLKIRIKSTAQGATWQATPLLSVSGLDRTATKTTHALPAGDDFIIEAVVEDAFCKASALPPSAITYLATVGRTGLIHLGKDHDSMGIGRTPEAGKISINRDMHANGKTYIDAHDLYIRNEQKYPQGAMVPSSSTPYKSADFTSMTLQDVLEGKTAVMVILPKEIYG